MLSDDRADRIPARQPTCRWCGSRPTGVNERFEMTIGLGLCQACLDRMDTELMADRAPGPVEGYR
jgi:hypothetical protein